ncbi:Dynein beta chain [Diplonema papillatum]|nr:Dynein beta chain [Diplonema papillatum]
MTGAQWSALAALSAVDGFGWLLDDAEKRQKRWRDWAGSDRPEADRLPGEARHLNGFERLLAVKAFRPDRVPRAAENYAAAALGSRLASPGPVVLHEALRVADAAAPILLTLFPGADPVSELEGLAEKMGISEVSGSLRLVALGRGQGSHALRVVREAADAGAWVVLSNAHLMDRAWLSGLEGVLEDVLRRSQKKAFRVFLTAEPARPRVEQLPPGLVQTAVKLLVQEPTTALRGNLQRFWGCFNAEHVESALKGVEHRQLLFGLAYFHAAVVGRARLGAGGFTGAYAFGAADLAAAADVLSDHLDPSGGSPPFEELRAIVGTFVYGSHVTDAWDQRTIAALLEAVLREEFLVTGTLAPGFTVPQGATHQQYLQSVEFSIPDDSPTLLHMHATADTRHLVSRADGISQDLRLLCGHTVGLENVGSSPGGVGPPAKERVLETLARVPEQLDAEPAGAAAPPAVFLAQEVRLANRLLSVVRSSLADCLAAITGTLAVSELLAATLAGLEAGVVPGAWAAAAYPSLLGLGAWLADLALRHQQLAEWRRHEAPPVTVWVAGLFRPEAFVAAVLQVAARKSGAALDGLALATDAVKKSRDDLAAAPREGAYIHGMFLEGATWDSVAVCASLIIAYTRDRHHHLHTLL